MGGVLCKAKRLYHRKTDYLQGVPDKERIKACSLQKKWGAAQKDADGSCLGFSNENDDEPIDKCKNCIACSAFDWEEERRRLSI